MVQVFRRPGSPLTAGDFKLQGLDRAARYSITNMDVPGASQLTGQELMEKGLLISLKEQPDSALIVYTREK
jgi:hypothetical protein